MVRTRKQAMKERKWSSLAERGLDKFSSLKTSKAMRAYRKKFDDSKPSSRSDEKFYEFVARARLRKKS